ncbi:MAG: hypothetical protein HDQ95_08350 [Roseburia sp.]|nr:hypothetical protein [Roseburia sp.]
MHQKYRKFRSIDEAIWWGEKHYAYWLPEYQLGGKLRGHYETENPVKLLVGEFTQKEIEELKNEAIENKWFSFYCGGNWGLAINEKLRYGNTQYPFSEKGLIEMQQVMDNCLERTLIPENIWGYRFLKYKDLCRSVNRHFINCGMLIEDKGYMGVGLVKPELQEEFGGYNTLLEIMIPKGTKGLYIDLISNRRKEQEVLFARGSKMRVLFCHRRKGKRIITCKMIKPACIAESGGF